MRTRPRLAPVVAALLLLTACGLTDDWTPVDFVEECEPDGAERAEIQATVKNATGAELDVSVSWVLQGLTTMDATELAGGPTLLPGAEGAFDHQPNVKAGATIEFTFTVTDADGTHELTASVFADRSCALLFTLADDGELTLDWEWF